MEKLNGIVLDGKFYQATKGGDCDKCDLRGEYCKIAICTNLDARLSGIHIFRFNKQITQKLSSENPRKFRQK